MKLLKEKYTIRKTIGQILLDTFIISLLLVIPVYLFYAFSDKVITHLNLVAQNNISAIKITLIIYPILLVAAIIMKSIDWLFMHKEDEK